MAVSATDIVQYASLNMPTDDTSISGGAISAVVIDDSSIGQLFPSMMIDTISDTTWYYKIFIKNENATDTLYKARFYIQNGLYSPVSSGTVALVSTSSSDTYTARIVGLDDSATPIETYEDVVLTGQFTVYSLLNFSEIHHVELLDNNGLAVNANGIITITRGIQIGIIPIGCCGATGEYWLSMSASLDDSLSVANRLTAPTDGGATPVPLVFQRPNIIGDALPSTGVSQNIIAGSKQGIWVKWICPANSKSIGYIPLWIDYYGYDSTP